ncbi:LysO family transporter [Helicovermis profundi]|uniref:Lysine exporter LysO family protein n=1 Tax=Helicovermis profundi TaxID=3065157 RepID=A0AAU9E7N7_9FIRM|nr:lysine exporter LysO family protein [Clostridia bacterium S502]
MTKNILLAVSIGIIIGHFFVPIEFSNYIELFITISLSFVLFLVGIDLGINRSIFKGMKKHGLIIIMIPIGVILGTLFGGVLSSIILKMPLNKGLSVSAGFGWYSLSGIILTKLDSAKLGTIAFLSNVFRELLTFITIPFIAKYLNDYSVIAPAGATAMDTTLPLVSKYTSPEVVVMSFFSGALLSTLVPFLVPFFYSLF